REAYVDADALVEHALNVREARAVMFAEFAYDHKMTFYGDPSPRLAGLVDKVGVDVTWFTLLQALEPASVACVSVPSRHREKGRKRRERRKRNGHRGGQRNADRPGAGAERRAGLQHPRPGRRARPGGGGPLPRERVRDTGLSRQRGPHGDAGAQGEP